MAAARELVIVALLAALLGTGGGAVAGSLAAGSNQGMPGAAGDGGEAGTDGRDGDPGAPGRDGADGADGADGTDGRDGVDGRDGTTGPAGERGASGPAGPRGLTGATGATGARGATGPIGEAGPQGVPGPQGPMGPAGPIGETGAVGPAGPQGPIGLVSFARFPIDSGFDIPGGLGLPLGVEPQSSGAFTPEALSSGILLPAGVYRVSAAVAVQNDGDPTEGYLDISVLDFYSDFGAEIETAALERYSLAPLEYGDIRTSAVLELPQETEVRVVLDTGGAGRGISLLDGSVLIEKLD